MNMERSTYFNISEAENGNSTVQKMSPGVDPNRGDSLMNKTWSAMKRLSVSICVTSCRTNIEAHHVDRNRNCTESKDD